MLGWIKRSFSQVSHRLEKLWDGIENWLSGSSQGEKTKQKQLHRISIQQRRHFKKVTPSVSREEKQRKTKSELAIPQSPSFSVKTVVPVMKQEGASGKNKDVLEREKPETALEPKPLLKEKAEMPAMSAVMSMPVAVVKRNKEEKRAEYLKSKAQKAAKKRAKYLKLKAQEAADWDDRISRMVEKHNALMLAEFETRIREIYDNHARRLKEFYAEARKDLNKIEERMDQIEKDHAEIRRDQEKIRKDHVEIRKGIAEVKEKNEEISLLRKENIELIRENRKLLKAEDEHYEAMAEHTREMRQVREELERRQPGEGSTATSRFHPGFFQGAPQAGVSIQLPTDRMTSKGQSRPANC